MIYLYHQDRHAFADFGIFRQNSVQIASYYLEQEKVNDRVKMGWCMPPFRFTSDTRRM